MHTTRMPNTIEFGSGDNTTTSTSSHPEMQHAPVNSVTMKPPPFYRTNPTVWFRHLESQFILAGIAKDTTKYHHNLEEIPENLMQVLPISTRSSITEHLDLPPNKFAKLADTINSNSKDTFQEIPHVYATRQSSSSSYAHQPQPKQRNWSTDNYFQPF